MTRPEGERPRRPERILLVRFGALGDLVLATGLIDALGRETPAPRIDLLTKAQWAPLLEGDTRLERVLAFRGGLFSLLAHVRSAGYSRVYDLQASPRSRLVAIASGAKRTYRLDKRSRERRALLGGAPASPRLAGGVVSWIGEAAGGVPVLPRLETGPRLAPARSLLASRGVGEGFLAIAPGAGRKTKRWPERHVAAFAREAADLASRGEGPAPLLVGSAGEGDLLVRVSEASGAPYLMPPLPLLPAVLSLARLLVTGDTAGLHVAEAVGTPVVALFGPTVASFGFAPRDARSLLLDVSLPCRPCSLHGGDVCPEGHHGCLEGIEPQRVLAAVRQVLGRPAAEAPAWPA